MLEYLKLFVTLLPMVITLVRSVEEALPGVGMGQGKLQLALDTLVASAEFAQKSADEITQMKPALVRIINSAVSVLNMFKAWKA